MKSAERVVLGLFTASGVSGLIYQVVWVREFGNVFGNSVHSAAVVTAVFMLGLGLGSLVAGRWADRRIDPNKPLVAYGAIEAAIAAWGLGLAVLFPSLLEIGGALSTYVEADGGWRVLSTGTTLLRLLAAVILLFPATFMMGATLTLLVRFVVLRRLDQAGWRIGLLYGLNTLGAAGGALATDLVLIPTVGLFTTQSLAVTLNLIAAVGALRVARSSSSNAQVAPAIDVDDRAESALVDRRRIMGAAAGLACAGAAGMGFEILWFRLASSVLNESRTVFSMMLAVILLGIAVGALVGGWLHRKFERPVAWYLIGQAVFACVVLVGIVQLDKYTIISGYYEVRDVPLDTFAGLWRGSWWPTLRPLLMLCLGPALMMGLTYPLANAAVQRLATTVGFRAGLLYLANTMGAVVGSLLVGLLWLPAMGIRDTVTGLLVIVTVGALLFLLGFWVEQTRTHRVVASASIVVACGAVLSWASTPREALWEKQFLQLRNPDLKILTKSEGTYQSILVTEDPTGARVLVTNGYSMSATNGPAQRYMRSFVHVPMIQIEQPRTALVICFGVGNTAHAASLHPFERIDVVDLSVEILDLAEVFASTNHNVLQEPNVRVHVNDGRNHLTIVPEDSYDLVTMEPPPIATAGIAALYSRDFYTLAKSRLRSGGYVTQWLPAYQVPKAIQRSVIAAFVEVFDNAVLLVGAGPELILMGQKDGPNLFDPVVADRIIRARPKARADMERIGLRSVQDVIAMFAGGPEQLLAVSADDVAVTDDFPILEYKPPSFSRCPLEARMFAPRTIAEWCPTCRSTTSIVGDDLVPRMAALATHYRTGSFLGADEICE